MIVGLFSYDSAECRTRENAGVYNVSPPSFEVRVRVYVRACVLVCVRVCIPCLCKGMYMYVHMYVCSVWASHGDT